MQSCIRGMTDRGVARPDPHHPVAAQAVAEHDRVGPLGHAIDLLLDEGRHEPRRAVIALRQEAELDAKSRARGELVAEDLADDDRALRHHASSPLTAARARAPRRTSPPRSPEWRLGLDVVDGAQDVAAAPAELLDPLPDLLPHLLGRPQREGLLGVDSSQKARSRPNSRLSRPVSMSAAVTWTGFRASIPISMRSGIMAYAPSRTSGRGSACRGA